jgi:hypothetical protein
MIYDGEVKSLWLLFTCLRFFLYTFFRGGLVLLFFFFPKWLCSLLARIPFNPLRKARSFLASNSFSLLFFFKKLLPLLCISVMLPSFPSTSPTIQSSLNGFSLNFLFNCLKKNLVLSLNDVIVHLKFLDCYSLPRT